MKAFSFELAGDFALFKKNDANDIILTSYNFIHKPVVLGILGAIIGLKGYGDYRNFGNKKDMPEYYRILKNIKIGIKPHYIKPLKKAIVEYNNASGMGARQNKPEMGITWQITEQVLVGEPEIRYTIFIFEEDVNYDNKLNKKIKELKENIKKLYSKYPIYFGKNEFLSYFENFREYQVREIKNSKQYYFVSSLVDADSVDIKEMNFENFDPFQIDKVEERITVYENLPYDFDEEGFYVKKKFLFTTEAVTLKTYTNFYELSNNKKEEKFVIQFF